MKEIRIGMSLGAECFGEQASTISTDKDRSALVKVAGGSRRDGSPLTRVVRLSADFRPRCFMAFYKQTCPLRKFCALAKLQQRGTPCRLGLLFSTMPPPPALPYVPSTTSTHT